MLMFMYKRVRSGMHIYFPTWYPNEIRTTALIFSFSTPPYSLFPLIQGRRARLLGGTKITIPGWPMHYYVRHNKKKSVHFVQASGQSFPVIILTPHTLLWQQWRSMRVLVCT